MRYDYAISFAAPERPLARELCQMLSAHGCRVFFDEEFEHEMLGADGADYLSDVFVRQAASCITLISDSYTKRAWTELERRAAQARELSDPGYVIPVVVDGTRPSWLLPTKIFFDLAERSLEELAKVLVRRLGAREFGPFRRRHVLGQLFDTLTSPIATYAGERGYVTWCAKLQDEPPSALRIDQSPDSEGGWRTTPLGIQVRGSHLLVDGKSAIVIPHVARDPIEILRLDNSAVPKQIVLPRQEAYGAVTDIAQDDDAVYVGLCGGDVWKLDVTAGSVERLSPTTDSLDYASVGLTATGIAISCGSETVSVRALDGSLISEFTPGHDVSQVIGLPSLGLIACAGSLRMSVVDEDSGETLDDYELPAHGAWNLAATVDGMVAFISGMSLGQNLLVLYDVVRKREVARLESGHHSSWSNLALQPDGSSLAVLAGEKLVIFEAN